MKYLKELTLVISILLLSFSCSEDQIQESEISNTEFINLVMSKMEANMNKGLTFGMFKPVIDNLAEQYGKKVTYPDNRELDELELKSKLDRAWCWPWEENSAEAFHHWDGESYCTVYLWYCDGEYDSWSTNGECGPF